MPKRNKKRVGRIAVVDMRHCLCCANAIDFYTDLDNVDSIEDMTVACPHFPRGDKMVELGTDCQHFLAVKRVNVI